MELQDMTDEQFDRYFRELSWYAVHEYDEIKDRLTDEQFDRCIRGGTGYILNYYDKFKDRITDEQITYCVCKEPLLVLCCNISLDSPSINCYYE